MDMDGWVGGWTRRDARGGYAVMMITADATSRTCNNTARWETGAGSSGEERKCVCVWLRVCP
jgi:hypothetical protein